MRKSVTVSSMGHLKSREAIMGIFGVSKDTVARWRRDGAPIIRIGRELHAHYEQLWAWLLQQDRES